jgi:hypothetical protein
MTGNSLRASVSVPPVANVGYLPQNSLIISRLAQQIGL